MAANRRDFIKLSALTLGLSLIDYPLYGRTNNWIKTLNSEKSVMKLSFSPYNLLLKHVFTVASNSRTTTPVVLTQIEYQGLVGYGEASMPPYLGETQESVVKFLQKVDLSKFANPFELDEIMLYIEKIDKNNTAAKASVDIALHDLLGKILQQPLYKLWGLNPQKTPNTSFTIGIDTPEVVIEKVKETQNEFKILKVKLGKNSDKEMINAIRSVSDVPLCVDVNQGWSDKYQALDMINWLHEKNVVFVEQPMPKEKLDDMAWLTQHSPLPTIADESVQRITDIKNLYQVFSGINIKLMKCGGLREAYNMMNVAKALEMKVMIGCMTETSCAVTAAAQLSPMADWADLDGNLLIKNDRYNGLKIIEGKVTLPTLPGIGVKPQKQQS
ncbi:MAG: dipeptide epimerase [Paludibacter sp.]|nr:dipeptide epimerase [Paludibacter sp.]